MAPHPTLSPRCRTGNVNGAGRGIQGEGPCFFHTLRKSLHRVSSSVLADLTNVGLRNGKTIPGGAENLQALEGPLSAHLTVLADLKQGGRPRRHTGQGPAQLGWHHTSAQAHQGELSSLPPDTDGGPGSAPCGADACGAVAHGELAHPMETVSRVAFIKA